MSDTNIAVLRLAADTRQGFTDRWSALSTTTQTRLKLAVLIGAVVAGYHYSLSSLLQTAGYDTPLAYVGLVPVLALGLAILHRHPRTVEPPIHDRQLDHILGLPLIGAALVAAIVLPAHIGALYWLNRIDLLSLPIFVAGSTILLFGTRVAWRQKMAIGYLFLAWPWPYTHILLGTLGGFTSVTLSGLHAMLHVLPVAQPVSGLGSQGLFQVIHHGHAFPVSVVTACSGVDGMVGFFLVGAGFAGTVTGPKLRKVVWLATGLVLLWTTNLLRLLFIFWVGGLAGEHLAINILHPVAGLVIFCIGVVLMMLLLRPFGLRMMDMKSGFPTTAPGAGGGHQATPRVFAAVGIVAIAALGLGINNSALRAFDPVANASGEPRLASFLAQPAAPSGWEADYLTEYYTNKPLFGQTSRWFRYLYTRSKATTDLPSTLPITADVINSKSLGSFSQFGVTACYTFHGYTLRDVAKVDLGNGISGQALSYSGATSAQDWSIVYWVWPVATGSGTRFERIILYLQNTAGGQVGIVGHQPAGVAGLKGALGTNDVVQRRLINNRTYLVTFAREIIQGQTKKTDTTVKVASLHPGGAGPVVTGQAAQASKNPQDLWARIHVRPPVPAKLTIKPATPAK